MTSFFQVIDQAAKQHTTTIKSPDFSNFSTRVISCTQIASVGCGPTMQPSVNFMNDKESFQFDGEELLDEGQ